MIENPIIAFAHGYGWDDMPKGWRARRQFREARRREKRDGKEFKPPPGKLSKLVMDAAAVDASDYTGVAGGEVYKGYPPFADTAQQYMASKFPNILVINFGKAWTSSTEVRAVRKGVIERGWKNRRVKLIVPKPHERRDRLLAERANRSRKIRKSGLIFEVNTAESILFDPATYGGEETGKQKVAEYRTKYAGIEEDEKYQKLVKQEPFAVRFVILHLDRPLDFVFVIRRPRF